MSMATNLLNLADGKNAARDALACHRDLRVRRVRADMVSVDDELLAVSLTRPSRAFVVRITGAVLSASLQNSTGIEGHFTTNVGLLLDIDHAGFADGCKCCYQVVLPATRENIMLAKEWLSFECGEVAEFCSRELSKLLQ